LKVKQEFHIGENITLKLEDSNPNSYRDWTVIYVNGEQFLQCHFLLITVSEDNQSSLNKMESIDEMELYLSKIQETNPTTLTPEEEFVGHCSNLQAWFEYGYDTRLLHRFLAFPLLKRLTEIDDNQARKVFKEEIRLRLLSGVDSVVKYLVTEGYIDYFTVEEWRVLKREFSPDLKKCIEVTIIDVLKTVGTSHNRKEQLFNFLLIFNETLASSLEGVEFNGEKFFPKNGVLKFHITKDKSKKIKEISEIMGLDQLKSLKEIYLWNQDIREIKSLDKLIDIEVLNLHNNKIEEIRNIDTLINLRKLSLKKNKIIEIKGLTQQKNLNYLDLSENRIKDIKGLESLVNLKSLNLRNNYIIEINGLEKLNNLEILDLGNNRIRKIKNINHLINLKNLRLEGNVIPEHYYKKIKWKNKTLGDIEYFNFTQ
jgi:hypothetical protein